jgi:hypothetical protein
MKAWERGDSDRGSRCCGRADIVRPRLLVVSVVPSAEKLDGSIRRVGNVSRRRIGVTTLPSVAPAAGFDVEPVFVSSRLWLILLGAAG